MRPIAFSLVLESIGSEEKSVYSSTGVSVLPRALRSKAIARPKIETALVSKRSDLVCSTPIGLNLSWKPRDLEKSEGGTGDSSPFSEYSCPISDCRFSRAIMLPFYTLFNSLNITQLDGLFSGFKVSQNPGAIPTNLHQSVLCVFCVLCGPSYEQPIERLGITDRGVLPSHPS